MLTRPGWWDGGLKCFVTCLHYCGVVFLNTTGHYIQARSHHPVWNCFVRDSYAIKQSQQSLLWEHPPAECRKDHSKKGCHDTQLCQRSFPALLLRRTAKSIQFERCNKGLPSMGPAWVVYGSLAFRCKTTCGSWWGGMYRSVWVLFPRVLFIYPRESQHCFFFCIRCRGRLLSSCPLSFFFLFLKVV